MNSNRITVHETAIVEDGVEIGDRTFVWDNVHIRGPSRIGEECIIGGKSYIAYDVNIGNRVKINANVYICALVSIEDGVMISAGTIFTNDRFPRAASPDLSKLKSSAVGEDTLPTLVREGATIGAGSIIGCDLEIGRFAMVGMGSVVTSSVPDFALVVGHPARIIGYVNRHGQRWLRCTDGINATSKEHCCSSGYRYTFDGQSVTEHLPGTVTDG